MTRSTSIEAWRKLKRDGKRQGLQEQVVEALKQAGEPLTSHEIADALHIVQRDSISPRMIELRRQGLIVEVARRKCRITGHKKIVWDIAPEGTIAPIERAKRKYLIELLGTAREISKLARDLNEPQQAYRDKWLQDVEAVLLAESPRSEMLPDLDEDEQTALFE